MLFVCFVCLFLIFLMLSFRVEAAEQPADREPVAAKHTCDLLLSDYELEIVAMTMWGESRNSESGMRQVARTIKFRVMNRNQSVDRVIKEVKLVSGAWIAQFDGYWYAATYFPTYANSPLRPRIYQIALEVFCGEDGVEVATDHFHASYMTPYWAKDMRLVDEIGGQKFYISA